MSRRLARRVIGAAKRVEETPFDFARGRRAPRVPPSASISIGRTNTAITARSGTTPGSGQVVIQVATTSAITPGTDTVTAYNFSGTGIATGKYVAVLMSDPPWIVAAEC